MIRQPDSGKSRKLIKNFNQRILIRSFQLNKRLSMASLELKDILKLDDEKSVHEAVIILL